MPMSHPPHPETCLLRLLTSATALMAGSAERRAAHADARIAALLTDPQHTDHLAGVIREAAHLAVMQQNGLLDPVLQALRYVYFTPAQHATLALALERWQAQQPKGAPDEPQRPAHRADPPHPPSGA